MKKLIGIALMLLIALVAVSAGEKEVSTDKLVNWMREINTRQAEFQMANKKYADAAQLRAFAQERQHPVLTTELAPSALAPYTLEINVSADGAHYLATIKRPSDMKDKSTWCKTAVFSDDSGLIYVGKNIGCSDK